LCQQEGVDFQTCCWSSSFVRAKVGRENFCAPTVQPNSREPVKKNLQALCFQLEAWGGRRGSNPRHSVPQTDALPAELLPPLVGSLAWRQRARKRAQWTEWTVPSGLRKPRNCVRIAYASAPRAVQAEGVTWRAVSGGLCQEKFTLSNWVRMEHSCAPERASLPGRPSNSESDAGQLR
jgi:hypothetical protein